ncbi:hypothetical protein [Desulfonema magnum]|uniref:Uncharacterized protein n=1 Tax=Desulfonema magnum TaxID=45655 RepID=A0A975BTC0_9BACT|nr:hypothetical protein [Desulfonema magnum]QTA91306.1 Uncharacterized protein dnm_073700 [Desulfonema magnum]
MHHDILLQNLTNDIHRTDDFNIIKARGVDFSEHEICFQSSENLPFEYEGKRHRHRAYLIWMKHLPEDGYCFGLKIYFFGTIF